MRLRPVTLVVTFALGFYDPADIRIVDGLYVIDSRGKEKLEEKQKDILGE